MTPPEPGERRPQLDRAPGDRYRVTPTAEDGGSPGERRIVWPPLAVGIGGALVYTILGGVLAVTAGLIVVAAFVGWLLGKLIRGPARAATAAALTVAAGLIGIWLFSHIEGGVLDPITYLDDVQGWPLVVLQLLVGAGLAAASSR